MIAVYGAVALATDSPACLVSFYKQNLILSKSRIFIYKKIFGKKVKYDQIFDVLITLSLFLF